MDGIYKYIKIKQISKPKNSICVIKKIVGQS